jgi:hypothetical protein
MLSDFLKLSRLVRLMFFVCGSERSRKEATVSPRFIMGGLLIFSPSLNSMVTMHIAFMALKNTTMIAIGRLSCSLHLSRGTSLRQYSTFTPS